MKNVDTKINVNLIIFSLEIGFEVCIWGIDPRKPASLKAFWDIVLQFDANN